MIKGLIMGLIMGLILFAFHLMKAAGKYCMERAESLNRNKLGWGLFGVFIPVIPVIWIRLLDKKYDWDEDTKDAGD